MLFVRSWPRSSVRAVAAAALSLGAVGCDAGPTEPVAAETPELTVDASNTWAFVTLGQSSSPVSVVDPAASEAWDLAFHATSVMLNGGAAGPGGVVGHCLCQNAGASDAQVRAMTPESELAAFEAVTAAQIPAAAEAWQSDELAAAISGWYDYDPATHVVSANPNAVWKVRTSDGAGFAKLRVAALQGAARSNAGRVTLEYAVQAARGAPMSETRTLVADLSSNGKVYVDLVGGTVSDGAKWDLVLEGYTIRVNGGVSGSGKAGAVRATAAFGAIADASDLTDRHYRGDAYGGVFDKQRWYRYNLDGNHQIWPTYDVYLIKRGSAVYKVQVTGYYSATGDSRHITFRYARLAG